MSAHSPLGRIAQGLAMVAAAALLLLALLTVADVLLRYLLSKPIRGYAELASLATAVIVAAFFPLALVRNNHVTLRPWSHVGDGRAGRWADTFGALLSTVFFALMAWQYVRHTLELAKAGERTGILRIPVAPAWWLVTALITVTAAISLWRLLRPDRSCPPTRS